MSLGAKFEICERAFDPRLRIDEGPSKVWTCSSVVVAPVLADY